MKRGAAAWRKMQEAVDSVTKDPETTSLSGFFGSVKSSICNFGLCRSPVRMAAGFPLICAASATVRLLLGASALQRQCRAVLVWCFWHGLS